MEIICAIATDDGIHLMSRHFGDAIQYDLYQIGSDKVSYLETIKNPFREDDEEEDFHGDKEKASNMKELFLERNVSVLASSYFGPNIKHMVKRFVPVIIKGRDVEMAKKLLQRNYDVIQKMVSGQEDRKPIIAKDEQGH